jgi:hypothetical protein
VFFLLLFIEPSVIKILQPRKTGQHRITAEKRRAVLVSTARCGCQSVV